MRSKNKVFLFLFSAFLPCAFARQAAAPAADWPLELGPAVAAYYAGDSAETQRLCAQELVGTRDPRRRRAAAALYALTLLRSPTRADRLDGRARLAQVTQEDASFLEHPDCLLAFGIAQTGLNETAGALTALDKAAKVLAGRPADPRWTETQVALAEAWARHHEWELTPDALAPRPASPEQGRTIRREKIKECRARLAQLPGREDAVARVDLVLARNLIDEGDAAAAGVELLRRLTAAPRWSPAAAEGAVLLAARYEQEKRWADALALYQRLQTGDFGDYTGQAELRVREITQPQLVLDAPAQHQTVAQKVPLRLRVRNLPQAQVEVRRLDLAGWLAERQGRLVEDQLPVAGAVVAAHDLRTTGATAYDWWSSDAAPLDFAAPPGAYVIVARAKNADGSERLSKKLLTVGDLRAALFVGPQQALLWTARGAQAPAAEPAASFWMHGSFVPTRVAPQDGVARFALPAEAAILRDRRWVCLIQAGEHLALVRGQLPDAATAGGAAPAVALVGGPVEPRAGEDFFLYGLLLDRKAPREAASKEPVQVEFRDAADRAVVTQAASVSPAGTFTVRAPLAAELAGQQLRVVLRRGGQTLENVHGSFSVRVAPENELRPLIACKMPVWLPADAPQVPVEGQAEYPWGAPLADGRVNGVFRAVPLPVAGQKAPASFPGPLPVSGRLDARGQFEFSVPPTVFKDLPPEHGPLAVGAWITVAGWDGRLATHYSETLLGPQPVHLWLTPDAPRPRAGEPLRFALGWFDPGARLAGGRPTLEVRRDGQVVATLACYPTATEFQSEPWRPDAPGAYELLAAVPAHDGAPLTLRQTLEVQPAAASNTFACDARLRWKEGRFGVEVQLRGVCARPLLIGIESGEPLAAQALPGCSGAAELFVPLKTIDVAAARVHVMALDEPGPRLLATTAARPAQHDVFELAANCEAAAVAPGTSVEVTVTAKRTGGGLAGTTVLARLIDAADSGYVQWLAGEGRSLGAAAPPDVKLFSSMSVPAANGASEPGMVLAAESSEQEFAPALRAGLFEGATLWGDCQAMPAGTARFNVPLPPRPGRYRLIFVARTPDGLTATHSLPLDAHHGLEVLLDAPRRLSLGDRTLVALRLANRWPRTITGHVTVRGGDGMHVERVQSAGGTAAPQVAADNSAATLTLESETHVTLKFFVEAARAGEGVFEVEVEADGKRQRLAAPYEVLREAGPAAEAGPKLRVARTLILLTPADSAGSSLSLRAPHEPAAPRAAERWQRTVLRPEDALAPGQWLLVREEFSADAPLENVEWSQRLPAACQPPLFPNEKPRQIGEQRLTRRSDGVPLPVRSGFLDYTAKQLSAGMQAHEYYLVVLRPGVFQLPPPEVRSAGRALPVELQGGETRLRVSTP